jgi:phenylpyruvate tautomerase
MPYLHFQTSVFLSDGARDAAASEFSQKVAELLAKPESYVQVRIDGGCTMSFGGETGKTAFVELYSLGLDEEAASECSRELCALIEERFSIPADRVYLKMADHPRGMWGWDGQTFKK